MLTYRGTPLSARRIMQAVQRRLSNRFERANTFRGVYPSFADAERAAPQYKPTGYELAQSDDWYLSKLDRVTEEDYPVLFWLRPALETARTIYEIGGHVGVAYYGYETVLPYPDDLQWTICDVSSVILAGRALARERGRRNIHFVTHPSQSDGVDIVLAAGSLQYVDSPTLAETVASFRVKPKHVIVNNTPVCEGPSFVTLQNIVSAYCPYRIFNRADIVIPMEKLGYTLVDSWQKTRAVRIPHHPDKSTDAYAGFYFRAG